MGYYLRWGGSLGVRYGRVGRLSTLNWYGEDPPPLPTSLLPERHNTHDNVNHHTIAPTAQKPRPKHDACPKPYPPPIGMGGWLSIRRGWLVCGANVDVGNERRDGGTDGAWEGLGEFGSQRLFRRALDLPRTPEMGDSDAQG